jgi:uncharacterized membrane protein YjjB (DUF3815 family)
MHALDFKNRVELILHANDEYDFSLADRLLEKRKSGTPVAYLIGAAASSFYAEIMARIRKFPATSYLMCALVPLIPGSGIYYTMDFIRRGMLQEAYNKGMATAAIAGSMAVGVLLVSTGFRMWSVGKQNLRKKKAKA